MHTVKYRIVTAAVIKFFFFKIGGAAVKRKRLLSIFFLGRNVLYTETGVFLVGKMEIRFSHCIQPPRYCIYHKCLQVLCGTAATALQLRAPKWLRLLNGSGRYKLLILKKPDFAAVKRKRLLNGSGGNSAFYGSTLDYR